MRGCPTGVLDEKKVFINKMLSQSYEAETVATHRKRVHKPELIQLL